MPVREFEGFLKERRLISKGNLASLKDTRLGVDGFFWLRKILTAEPHQSAIGGTPITLEHNINAELTKFREASITPVFIFNGLQMPRQKPFGPTDRVDRRAQNRKNAWEYYNNGNIEKAKEMWNGTFMITLEIMNCAMKIFKENGVQYFRAPNLSWAQLAWLEHPKQSYLHGIYGGPELFVFGANKVITKIDLTNGCFEWSDKKLILGSLNIVEDQLIDLCIFAGFDYSSTFPPLLTNRFQFADALNLVLSYPNGLSVIQQYINHPQVIKSNYSDVYLRARCLVKHHLVFNHGCKCEPLNKNSCPNDLHEILGPRLPDDIYFFLSQGVVSPQVLNTLISGYLVERPPLCGGDTLEYRRLLDQLNGLRGRTLSIISQHGLHQSFSQKKVVTLRWFDSFNEHELNHFTNPFPNGYFVVSSDNLKNIEYNANDQGINLLNIIQMQKDQSKAVSSRTLTPEFEGLKELMASVMLSTLYTSDYVVESGTLTTRGKALENVNDFVEPTFIIMELLRTGHINSSEFTAVSKKSQEMAEENKEEEAKRLISRILSVVPVTYGSKTWDAPVNFDLLCFNSLVKAVNRTYRNMTEMILLQCMRLSSRNLNLDYSEIGFRLPFFHEANVGMGLIFLSWASAAEDVSLEQHVQESFSFIPDPNADLRRGFKFWKQMFGIISFLKDNASLPSALYDEFEKADNYLQSKIEKQKYSM